jgi:hypothetical protein
MIDLRFLRLGAPAVGAGALFVPPAIRGRTPSAQIDIAARAAYSE